MREVKFRGMDIQGNWYYGLLAKVPKEYHTQKIPAGFYISNKAGSPFAYRVRPETVGQYTGLKDKNGVEIYEGDRVRIIEDDEDSCFGNTFEHIAIVAYENGEAVNTKYVTQYPCSFCLISKQFYLDQALFTAFRKAEFEIIGKYNA